MESRIGVCVFLTLLSFAATAQKSVNVYDGYLKGASYLALPETSRVAYAMGVVDGLLSSGFYGADPAEVKKLQRCTGEMSSKQLEDVLYQHVRTHPANVQDPMNVLATNALVAACPVMRAAG